MEGKPKLFSLDTKIIRLMGIVLIIFSIYWLTFGGIQPHADSKAIVQEAIPQSLAQEKNLKIDVQPNGDIYINDKRVRDTIIRHQQYDEVKLILVDELGEYIPKITVTLNLPTALADKDNSFDMLAIHGADKQNPKKLSDTSLFFAANNIEPTARITIFAQLPSNELNLSLRARLLSLGTTYKSWVFWLAGFLIPLFTFLSLKFSYNRSLKSKVDVGSISEPPGTLSPAAVGLLVNGRLSYQQLAATLVAMAARGDIQLVQTIRGYRIAKKKELINLSETERFLVDELRLKLGPISRQDVIEQEVKKQLFSKKITNAYEAVFQELEERGFFATNPYKFRDKYRFWGLSIVAFSLIISLFVGTTMIQGIQLIPATSGIFLAGWLILLLTPQLPPLTNIGSNERAKWISFKNYITHSNSMSGGQDNAKLFIQYLPYAITLNSTHQWLSRFNTQFILVPEWYFNEQDPSSLDAFIYGLENITSEISHTLTQAALPVT